MKFIKNYKPNKKIVLFLLVILVVAFLSGSILTVILTDSDKEIVVQEINDFLSNLSNINYLKSLQSILIYNLVIILLIWIFGLSIIGGLISIIILFIKTFEVGFTISSFILLYNYKGILLGFCYLFPIQILKLLILIFIISYSLIISFNLLEAVVKKKTINFKLLMNKYRNILIITIISTTILSLLETFILPFIFNLLAPLI